MPKIDIPDSDSLQADALKRDRVLAEDELRYLLRALDAERTILGQVVRLLLLTGQRRAEVAGLRWSELRNLDTDGSIWEIPGKRTKNKQTHLVPLALGAKAAILEQPRIGDLVFSTTGDTSVSGFGKVKARFDDRIRALRAADGVPSVCVVDPP